MKDTIFMLRNWFFLIFLVILLVDNFTNGLDTYL